MNDTDPMRPTFGKSALAILAAISVLQVTNAQTTSSASSSRDELLVTTDWLKQHSSDKDLVVLHIGEKQDYKKGHIPGARFVDSDKFGTHNMAGGLMLELPPIESLHQTLESLGVTDTSRIVVYFADDSVPAATRAIFTLDAAGLGNRTTLLDGGLRAWQRGGNAITKDVPTVVQGKLASLTVQPRVVDAAFVQQNLKSPHYKLVDARAPVYYDGVQAGMGQAPANLKGHLPGATNIPFTSVTATDLTLRSADELAAIFKAAGVVRGDHVIAYCHIGLQGTAVVFAARSLGIDAVLYDGSFQDWARRGLPVETQVAKAQ